MSVNVVHVDIFNSHFYDLYMMIKNLFINEYSNGSLYNFQHLLYCILVPKFHCNKLFVLVAISYRLVAIVTTVLLVLFLCKSLSLVNRDTTLNALGTSTKQF